MGILYMGNYFKWNEKKKISKAYHTKKGALLAEREYAANLNSVVDDKTYRKVYYARDVVRPISDGVLSSRTLPIEYKKSQNDTIMKFYDTLKKRGINVTVRREFGGNIDAACGQLRASEVER